jgi:hypothetical protein
MKKVFYSRELGDYVVDERCECGHPKREHGSVLKKLPENKLLRVPNDGSCCSGQCACTHFRWAGWVTATEVEHSIPECKRRELATN